MKTQQNNIDKSSPNSIGQMPRTPIDDSFQYLINEHITCNQL